MLGSVQDMQTESNVNWIVPLSFPSL